eukprot:SAG22_NODE_1669_length_3849_cov_3.221333_1_plen_382_part_10
MRQFVLGVDGNNDCVYWEAPALLPASAPTGVASVAKASAGARWECLNDGTCVSSNSSRAVFPTKQACLSGGCGTSFTCIPSSAAVTAYCLPLAPMQPGGASRPGIGNFTSLDSCAKACYPYWDWITECLTPPSGGMPSAYAVCGTPFGVEAKTGIYTKTQHKCDGQPVYQKGGANGPVLHRCRCPGSYDMGWCVSSSSQINDCSAARCPDHSDRFMDNAACPMRCVRPDAQQCNGQWRGLYGGGYWQAARFVTVVPVDPTRASEAYFLPGGACQFGNESTPTSTSAMSQLLRRAHNDGLAFFTSAPNFLVNIILGALVAILTALVRKSSLRNRHDRAGELYHQHKEVSVTPRSVQLNDESADPFLQQQEQEKEQKARRRRKH